MIATTSGERQQQLEHLKAWCLAIVRFLRELDTSPSLYSQLEEAIEAAFERGDLRGLKMVSRDLEEWAMGLPSASQRQLNNMLHARFGIELAVIARQRAREVARILKRGAIADEDEYRLLSTRADQIYADASKRDELDSIDRLMAAFKK
jgi:hypothetical protein